MAQTLSDWTRTEGIIIAEHLDPKAVADFIETTKVVATIDWYDRSPNLIGLTLAMQDEKLAGVNDLDEIVPLVEVEDFALEVAQEFNAEVMVGEVSADALPEDAEVGSEPMEPSGEPMKIVELTRIPDSSIPLAAALLGVDVAALELSDGWQALAYDAEYSQNFGEFGEYPIVTLMVSGDEFFASLAEEDDSEEVTIYNWSMSTRTIAAGHKADRVADEAEALVGASADLRRIAEAIPGADIVAAEATAQLQGTHAVASFVRAIGVPSQIADYLVGDESAEDIPGAEINYARGISNAIGRSVDKILLDPESAGNPMWETYHKVAVERPAIVRVIASVEAAVGATLIANAFRAQKPRSGWVKAGAVLGSLMMVDSVAEVMLSKYLGERADRYRD
ncbi:MAG: hypothetical protein Q4E01_07575 [Actinomycetaceae bacterium]|nr:hypothetical protein [Actinomycetaceae bacterium]